jgi:hypothetical protein
MISFMLYIDYMNITIHPHFTVQIIIRFIALSFFAAALADAKLDLASLALLPNETGASYISKIIVSVNYNSDAIKIRGKYFAPHPGPLLVWRGEGELFCGTISQRRCLRTATGAPTLG